MSTSLTGPHLNSADWNAIVDDWRESGLPMSRYCQQHDLITHQLGYYKRKFEAANRTVEVPSKGFSQVSVSSVSCAKGLTLRLSSGTTIEGINEQNLLLTTSLVRALL